MRAARPLGARESISLRPLDSGLVMSRDCDMDLDELGIDLAVVRRMYNEWSEGKASKSELERRYLNNGHSHGKLFSALVKRHLGVDTEQTHPLVKENRRLNMRVKELQEENERLRKQRQSRSASSP